MSGTRCGCCEKNGRLHLKNRAPICADCDQTDLWSEYGRCEKRLMFLDKNKEARCASCTCLKKT